MTYEGCSVINVGSLLRVESTGQRGRYAGSWWEWDCGLREGKEVSVGLMDREQGALGKLDKRERKRKVERTEGRDGVQKAAEKDGRVETQVEELQVSETQDESHNMEGVEYGDM